MSYLKRWLTATVELLARTPETLIALLARFSLAALFWRSGQTKIEGFKIDLIEGHWHLGMPRLNDSTIFLFSHEYNLPLINPTLAALLAALAEHLLPVLLLIGLGTRFAALGLLMMTLIIQIFVYPEAYPTHGIWAALLLYLIARGPGQLSFDRLFRSG